MRISCWWMMGCAALGLIPLAAQAKDARPATRRGVQLKPYGAWADCLHLGGANVQVVVAPEVGGRIVRYGLHGENVLLEPAGAQPDSNPNPNPNPGSAAPDPFRFGGYQVDLGPELRGLPPHQDLLNGPFRWQTPRDYAITLVSQPNQNLGVSLEKQMLFDPATGDLGVTQILRNISRQIVTACIWDRTQCRGGGYALFPLNKRSRFAAGWSLRKTIDGKTLYDGYKPVCPEVKVMDGVLVAHTQGAATKIGADSPAGWVAYARGKVLFVKYFPYDSTGRYTDGGNSVEVFWDEHVTELSPLSPEVSVGPGNTYAFPEKWTLLPLDAEVASFEQARALASRIEPFDF
jgi:hypothetical protein